jgi:excisionase family DNA binding protein
VTKNCSVQCASQAYKKRKRGKKVEAALAETMNRLTAPIEAIKAKEYISIKEACRLLGVSRWTMYRAIESHRLPALNLGRRLIIRRSDLEILHYQAQ